FHHTLEEVLKKEKARIERVKEENKRSRGAAQHKLKEEDMPAPREKLAMLQDTIAFLTGQGYQFIGMDHFAKPCLLYTSP
ncbi:oxygen-independent coproporphyrinogen III oxidase, partial [Aeromonas salmonicida]